MLSHPVSPLPFHFLTLEAEIVGKVAEISEHAFVAVVMTPFTIVIAAAHEIALDAVQEHFAADHGCGATQRAHHHIAALTLTAEEAAEHASLLVLRGHTGGRGNDTGETGAATGTVGRAYRRHSHADGTAQYHWLLAHHRRLRILGLPVWVRLSVGLLGLPVRLSIWLLWLPVGLLILRLSIRLWWLSIRLLRLLILRVGLLLLVLWVLAGLHVWLWRRCPCSHRSSTTGAEFHARRVLCPAVGAEAGRCRHRSRGCCRRADGLAAVTTEGVFNGNLRMAGRAGMHHWLRGSRSLGHMRTQRGAAMHAEGRSCFHFSIAMRTNTRRCRCYNWFR